MNIYYMGIVDTFTFVCFKGNDQRGYPWVVVYQLCKGSHLEINYCYLVIVNTLTFVTKQ